MTKFKLTDFDCALKGMVDKWDPVPGPQNPQDSQDPLGLYCKLKYKSTLNKGSNKIKIKKTKTLGTHKTFGTTQDPQDLPPPTEFLGNPQDPRDLRDPPELSGPSGTLETSSKFLGPSRTPWNPENFPGTSLEPLVFFGMR